MLDYSTFDYDLDQAACDNFMIFSHHALPSSAFRDSLPTELCVALVDIDPETANVWLHKWNSHNRRPKQRKNESYARDMTEGRWRFNGASISFTSGPVPYLADGQNRLMACVESKESFRSIVVFGLPVETQNTMDTGAARTNRDHLQLGGYENSQQLSPIVKLIICRQKGITTQSYAVSSTETEEFIKANPSVRAAAALAARKRRSSVQPAVIGAAYYFCAAIDQFSADVFFETKLVEGLSLERDDPVIALESFMDNQKVPTNTALDYVFLAWNKFRKGETVEKGRLRVNKPGIKPI